MMKTSAFLLIGLGAALATPLSAQDLTKQFPVQGGASSGASKPRPKGPQQETVAAKGAFPVAKGAELKGALPATNLAGAQKMIGKPVTVVGTVASVFGPKSGSFVLINFAKDFKTAVVGYVKKTDFAKFPALKTLKGKKVALHGQMISFKGAPEVELKAPGAIRIVK